VQVEAEIKRRVEGSIKVEEEDMTLSEMRAKLAEERLKLAEERVKAAEERLKAAEEKAKLGEVKIEGKEKESVYLDLTSEGDFILPSGKITDTIVIDDD
jgi:hypothetical protein